MISTNVSISSKCNRLQTLLDMDTKPGSPEDLEIMRLGREIEDFAVAFPDAFHAEDEVQA